MTPPGPLSNRVKPGLDQSPPTSVNENSASTSDPDSRGTTIRPRPPPPFAHTSQTVRPPDIYSRTTTTTAIAKKKLNLGIENGEVSSVVVDVACQLGGKHFRAHTRSLGCSPAPKFSSASVGGALQMAVPVTPRLRLDQTNDKKGHEIFAIATSKIRMEETTVLPGLRFSGFFDFDIYLADLRFKNNRP
ncbi:hypothetical protein V9T40_001763 [Parthenolecanium corni]|uniref:Uncharacterized protein n=1 Tax=Parthenolecanium corni TaxID=536013 RepID=A0AAN9TFE2_9HEMI